MIDVEGSKVIVFVKKEGGRFEILLAPKDRDKLAYVNRKIVTVEVVEIPKIEINE
ncbi:predicted protein [Sclerotinia sclerotiorum 1980 UF-70]|uniref:Uncharacterized protein n=1 Tax=Sclerotinia sclerotiorum (strain ATCC 18683 / 1980 / Ss-1) TaxID=665079 RepID=A7F6K0_SCLS1|nr:predicted protein [Sclerotinia sclerotiorum 1980 UF-70]EDN98371.1 predicted protein [Sclerotinia sclerotiorum 1980 UF-70]